MWKWKTSPDPNKSGESSSLNSQSEGRIRPGSTESERYVATAGITLYM